jgi:putative cell wall-binding protein
MRRFGDVMPVRSRTLALVLALTAAIAVLASPGAGAQEISDTLTVIKDGEDAISNAEVAARLSEATFESAGTVLIGRDDEFADAMTSGLLQADSPLLLVPRDGPVPQRVLDELAILNPSEVVLLGGPDALTEAVEEELADAGYTVRRTFGPTRFETAVAIAEEGPTEDGTIMIARAFGTPGGDDPTQAFADAMAAGGWAADERWPILLTQTAELPETTRRWLQENDVETAYVLGGTAAVSEEVEAELRTLVGTVERVAGADRFETAIEIAKERGAETAADAARVTLIEGQDEDAWAAGFSAAAHSAEFDAPIVLANDKDIPDATLEWLTGAVEDPAFAQAEGEERPASQEGFVLTCVVPFPVCEQAREALDLPGRATVAFTPASGSEVQRFSGVQVQVGAGPFLRYVIDGTCLSAPVEGTAPTTTVTITAEVGTECTISVTVTLRGEVTQAPSTATYSVLAQASEPPPPPQRVLALVTTPGGVVLTRMGIDGSERVDYPCSGCEELRVSPSDDRAVVQRDGALLVVDGPAFDPAAARVIAPSDGVDPVYSSPQFTPDGAAVVATIATDGIVRVHRISLDTDQSQVTPNGYQLAGDDAVRGTLATASGTGALVVPAALTRQSGDSLFVADVDTVAPSLTPLSTDAGIVDAAISPTGSHFAYARPGAEEVVVGPLEPSPTLTRTDADADPIYTFELVWSRDTTVSTVSTAAPVVTFLQTTAPPHQVDIATDGVVSYGPTVTGLRSPDRPDVLTSGHLLAVSGIRLADARTGALFGEYTGATDVTDPHLVSRGAPAPLPPVLVVPSTG